MNPLHYAALLACLSAVSGCSAGGAWYPGRVETFSGPGPNPPAGETETLARVANRWQPPLPPVLSESGNLWPGTPPAVLTLIDLRDQPAIGVLARPRRGGYGLCAPGASGAALGIC